MQILCFTSHKCNFTVFSGGVLNQDEKKIVFWVVCSANAKRHSKQKEEFTAQLVL